MQRTGDEDLGSDDVAVDPRWASRRPRPERSSSYRYLLDLDVELAEALDVRMRMVARSAATAVTFDADVGELDLSARLAAAAPGPGVLLLEGLLSVSVRVGDRTATELLGAGDLLDPAVLPDEELLGCMTAWRGLMPTRFAVLDVDFAHRIRPWPQLMGLLLHRMERRAHNLNVQRAIAAQPRLEIRLALLLWHLAARWGRVEPGGVRLPLPLTHQLLGRMVGAERPSVTHALGRLARAGLVTGQGDEWHLHGRIEDHLSTMPAALPADVTQLKDATSVYGQQ